MNINRNLMEISIVFIMLCNLLLVLTVGASSSRFVYIDF
jgi:hypothetical protein